MCRYFAIAVLSDTCHSNASNRQMSPRQRQRLIFAAILFIGFSTATGLVLYSLERNLLYFFAPSQIADGMAPQGRSFNLGGMVVPGSVRRARPIRFELTDNEKTVRVVYDGLLPDLFAEGQGVVATGRLNGDGVFEADEVLAKHDENYMPPDVADILKQPERNKPLIIDPYQK